MNVVRQKRICVIGGGVSGLCSIKNCLESNLDVVCYEKSNDIGGLWNCQRNTNKDEVTTVPDSTSANTSKEMFAFSDFPPPAEWPNWMHNKNVCQYLKMYAEKFHLWKYIRFNTTVEKIEKSSNYDVTGRWTIHLSNGNPETFDGIMICSGLHSRPYTPDVEGTDRFSGSVIHSQMCKKWKPYEDKRVLVIGLGNSSMDISVELAKHAKQVYLSTRRGGWIWGRMGIRGWPVDVRYLSRLAGHVFRLTPKYLFNCYFEHLLNMKIDHTDYGLKPKHRFSSQQWTFGDQLPTCISFGSVIIKDAVKQIRDHSVVFDDGTEEEIDALIFCTGYETYFPFLEPDLVPVKENRVDLYKFVFPPNLAHPTLAFVGFVQSFGGLGPMAEMQGRWITRIFNGELSLPSRNRMERDIARANKWVVNNFYKSTRHIFQTSYIDYMNELASFVGVRPNMLKLMLTDIKLFYYCYVGPCTAYTYRLNGPNTWPEARNTILKTYDRIDQPLKSRRGYPAIWKPFDRTLIRVIRLGDWYFPVMVIWCWITFGTDNETVFYVNAVILFTYMAILAAISDLFFDYSISF